MERAVGGRENDERWGGGRWKEDNETFPGDNLTLHIHVSVLFIHGLHFHRCLLKTLLVIVS